MTTWILQASTFTPKANKRQPNSNLSWSRQVGGPISSAGLVPIVNQPRARGITTFYSRETSNSLNGTTWMCTT